MNNLRFHIFIMMVSVFTFLVSSAGITSSLWTNGDESRRSSFAERVAITKGDILMIDVSESADGQTGSDRGREKEMEMGGSAGTGSDDSTFVNSLLSWIPLFGASFQGGSAYESSRAADLSGNLNTQMSVQVTEVGENGTLTLEGDRKIKVDDEVNTMRFEGLARQDDVKPDNTIPSDRIADAQIYYESKLGHQIGEPEGFLASSYSYVKNLLFW
ncbi:MAG: flagellar basal body L-ring protein FlgH [bacterium]